MEENLKNNSDDFFMFRLKLRKEENLLGSHEFDGISFNRKYILNISDQYVRLYYTNIKPVDSNIELKANLCIVHGFAHSSTSFLEMGYFLAKNGINCHLIDLRSHGLSGGARFDITIEGLHKDIISLIKQAETDHPNLPLFIFAHSLGGGLVTSLFLNNQYIQVHGVILSAPLLGYPVNIDMNPVKSYFISKLGQGLKDFVINGAINPTLLTKDNRELIYTMTDSKNVPISSMNSFKNIIKHSERILENARLFTLPVLIFHGKMDKIVNIEHSKIFHDTCRSKIKEMIIYDQGFHEMYADFEKEELFKKTLNWIETNKNTGKTDYPFPIDLAVGLPKQKIFKFKLTAFLKLIMFLIYLYIGYKLKQKSPGKINILIWPLSLLVQKYKEYILFEN